MRVVAAVQARTGSSRLPGKVLLPLAGRPVLWHIVRRLAEAGAVAETVVATTLLPADDPIAEVAARWGVSCFRGDADDVLGRLWGAAAASAADVLVRVPADKPLVDPGTVDLVVREHAASGADYTSNMPPNWPTGMAFPFGLEVEVAGRAALGRAVAEAADPADREGGFTFFWREAGRFRVHRVTSPLGLAQPDVRLALDTPEDYTVLEAVYRALWREDGGIIDARSAIAYLKEHPDIAALNRHVRQRGAG